MGLPAPELFSWLAGLTEFGGGLLLTLGSLTRPTALFIAATMLVWPMQVTLTVHGRRRSSPA
jgi:putative oxidoreductase